MPDSFNNRTYRNKLSYIIYYISHNLITYLFDIVGKEHVFQVWGDGVFSNIEINLEDRERETERSVG